jgi:hypothetical protein
MKKKCEHYSNNEPDSPCELNEFFSMCSNKSLGICDNKCYYKNFKIKDVKMKGEKVFLTAWIYFDLRGHLNASIRKGNLPSRNKVEIVMSKTLYNKISEDYDKRR